MKCVGSPCRIIYTVFGKPPVSLLKLFDYTGSNLHIYINPECEVPEEVVKVHGLDNAFLADKPTFAQVGQKIADYLQGAELIIHNAPFDVGFLNMEFSRMGLPETLLQTFIVKFSQ